MATLYTDKKTGGHGIKFFVDGKRVTLFLGKKYSKKTVTELQNIIEMLVFCRDNCQPADKRVMTYLKTAPPDVIAKIEKVGLVKQEKARTLDSFITDYVKERTDWKPTTVGNFNVSKKLILKFLGSSALVEDISVDKAVAFHLALKSEYSEATVSKVIKHCKQVFNLAKARKLVADSPFDTIKRGSDKNPARYYFVTMDEYHRLLEGCTHPKHRLIIALARIGGLRCPSELCGLRWSEINWQKKWFWVHSLKTEHHKGKDKRLVPLFPELELRFQEFFDTLPEGCDDLVFSKNCKVAPHISLKKSLGLWLQKVADRAGIELWEKPFQNCRSSRDTELRQRHPQHLVNSWIGQTQDMDSEHNQSQDWVNSVMGHSQQVAEDHYIQILPSDFLDACAAEQSDSVSASFT